MSDSKADSKLDSAVVANRVLTNIGLVLTRTKDALIKDFVEHLDEYLPDIHPEQQYTYEDFKKNLKDGKSPLQGFIESVFRKLGYDISNFEENQELCDLIRSILLATLNLGEAVKELMDHSSSWVEDLEEFSQKHRSGEVKDYETAVRELFGTDFENGKSVLIGNGQANVKISLAGDFGAIEKVFRLLQDVLDLVQKFKDLEAARIAEEYREFGEFLKDTYFTEKFAKRILDHILTVLLQNAREIFADDVQTLIEELREPVEEVRRQIEQEVGDTFDKIRERLQYLQRRVADLQRQLEEAAGEARRQLIAQLKVAREELEELCNKTFKDYNRVGIVLHRVYVILDFLQVIRKDTINLAQYIPDLPDIPELDEEELNRKIGAFSAVAKTAHKGIRELNGELEDIAGEIRALVPVTEIYVIDFDAVADLFTRPADYFQGLYPMDSLEDAEKLISKLLDVARAFNANVPDLQSLKSMLYDLLERIKSRMRTALQPLDDAAREMFAKFEKFILDILKALETFAVEVTRELKAGFQALEEGKDSVIGQLKESISTALSQIKAQGGKLQDFRLPGSNIRFFSLQGKTDPQVKDFLMTCFGEPFLRAFSKAAAQNDLLSGIRAEDWEKLIRKTVDENYDGNIIAGYKTICCEMEEYIDSLLSVEVWEGKFGALIGELKAEFEEQTRNVPDSYDEIKDFCKESVSDLIQGKDLENPFSDFDFNEYFNILSKHIQGMIPESPEIYFIRLRNVTVNSIGMLLKTGDAVLDAIAGKLEEAGPDEMERRIKDFAEDLFAAFWPEMRRAIHQHFFRPVLAQLEYCVKQWVRKVIFPEVVQRVKAAMNELIPPEEISVYSDVFDQVEQGAQEAVDLVADILLLTEDAKEIDDWQDGLRFAVKVYRAIPKRIKKYLRELVDLPSLDNLDIRLPEYSLSTENKFLAVTLYEYVNNDLSGEKYDMDASVSFKLVCFAGDRKMGDGEEAPVKSGVYFLPVIEGNFNSDFNLGKEHVLELNASACLNKGVNEKSVRDEKTEKALKDNAIGFFIYLRDGDKFPSINPIASADGVAAYLELLFRRGQKGDRQVSPLVIFKCKAAEMEMGNYPQKVYVGYDKGFDAGYIGGIENLKLTLKLNELNDLLGQLLKDAIVVNLEKLELGYTYKDGFRFDGDASLKIPLNRDFDLKAVKFSSMGLELGTGSLDNLYAKFLTSFTVDAKCVKITLPDVGIGFDWNFRDMGKGGFSLAPVFQMPDGLGITLDMECVKGSGLIQWNLEKGEYMGALEIKVFDKVGVSGLLLVNTRMPDGSKGLALVAILSAVFSPGIPLGMGFSLTGVGGSVGKDRMLNIDLIREGVRDGSLMSALLVKDLDKNLDNAFENIANYYPLCEDSFFLGLMGQITFAEIFKVDAGLFIQVSDDFTIMIAGVMSLDVTDTLDKLLSLHVAVMGAFNPSVGISLDASLFDSKIVGIELFGDMAMRIYWGGPAKGFLFSAGGFHPQYQPDAGFKVGPMQRLGFKLDYKILQLSLETYFAVTSNSVQFGADARLLVGWDQFGLSGRLYFNTLFQFNPFRFLFDVGISVAVKIGSLTLLSIGLDFALEGPAKWRVKGHAIFWFLFIKIEPSFNLSWGKEQQEHNALLVSVYPLLSDAILKNENWIAASTDFTERMVEFGPAGSGSVVMQPSDSLAFNQSAVPLSTHMERFGEAQPGDVRRIDLKNIYISGQRIGSVGQEKNDFAPSLVEELSNEDKLKRSSYEQMPSGFNLGADCAARTGAQAAGDAGREFVCQQGINLSHWERLVAAHRKAAGPETRSMRSMQTVGVITDHTFVQGNVLPDGPLPEGILQTERPVSRPSHRRSEEGFRRYIRKIDCITNKE